MSCSISIAAPPHRLLPRYLFSLVDAVSACERDARLLARKLVVHNTPSFQSRFLDDAVMPGLLVVESLAQGGGLRLPTTLDHAARTVAVASLGHAWSHWHGTVRSGGNLRLRVSFSRNHGALRTVSAESRVDVTAVDVAGALVCEGELAALVATR